MQCDCRNYKSHLFMDDSFVDFVNSLKGGYPPFPFSVAAPTTVENDRDEFFR